MSNQQQQYQFNQNWNTQQQQPVFQGQQNFNLVNQEFPSMGQTQTNSQQPDGQASNPFAGGSMDSNPFSIGATEFVPQGAIIATTEEFPDMGFDEAPKKKKAAQPSKQQLAQQQQEKEQAESSTKGKSKEFFIHQGTLSQEQMVFVFQYYPQYSMNPIAIVDWLYREGLRIEQEKVMAKQFEAENYHNKPSHGRHGGKQNQQQLYEEEDQDDEPEQTSIGQFQGGKKKNKPNRSHQNTDTKRIAAEKNAVKVKEQDAQQKTTWVSDKNVKINEDEITKVDESRQPASLVFIGHVDAGKSTISGQIMYLMGCVDERVIEKYKKEAKDKQRDSWWLAYCMDIGEEEKAKGKTVEVGRATFNTDHKQFTVFDAPGHKNYVPNMIVGAALADYAGLVISARKGEFEAGFEKDGQTREHVQLAKSLGVQKLVIVVNKMDEPSVNWNIERYNDIVAKLEPFLEKCGFSKGDVQYVPISGLTGDNILNKVNPITCKWYNGKTLIEILDQLPVENRDPNGPIRIPILHKEKEQGIIAHGKVESGTINVGDKIQISPSGYPSQIEKILDHKNESVKFARPGENVQITLIHINEESMINKGDVISCRQKTTPVTMMFEADMDCLELLQHKPIISKGYSCIMHCHTFADEITIETVLHVSEMNHQSGKMEVNEKAKFVKSLQSTRVRISTKVPMAMEKYDTMPQLGRFTLRDEGRTIAVGKILKYKPHKVESTIQVKGAKQEQQKADKNAALVFNMETGTSNEAKKALDAIAEE